MFAGQTSLDLLLVHLNLLHSLFAGHCLSLSHCTGTQDPLKHRSKFLQLILNLKGYESGPIQKVEFIEIEELFKIPAFFLFFLFHLDVYTSVSLA